MNDFYSWIYVDYINSIWKFSINANRELCYNIMYGEEKWTNERILDKDVLGFAVFIEADGKIHIVYSNTKGQIKYCTLKDKKWIGRILYQMDSEEFEIHNLKVNMIGNEMHIFYLLIEINSSNHGVLVHSVWNGKETKTTQLKDIFLAPNIKENYIVNVNEKKNIDVLFITEEGEAFSLNHYNYQNRKWTLTENLYSIQGHDIRFEMLNDLQDMHILNRYKEDSIFYLEHVCIKMNGDIQKFRVRRSRKDLAEPLLFKINNKLYTCWIEENKIYYSTFSGENWSSPTYFNRGNELKVERYHFYIASDQDLPNKERNVYGTGESDLSLFFPSQFVSNLNDILKYDANNAEVPETVEAFENLKLQLYRANLENKQLIRSIASLRMIVQKKQRSNEVYKEKVTKILEQKQKADENCDIIMELQQKLQKKLDSINQQLLEEKDYKVNVENKLKECEEENTIIKQQVEMLTEEKNKLNEELELEKNKSIVERILKG